jgi:hypothetical protein
MISQGSEALPLFTIEEATRVRFTDWRILSVPLRCAVGLRRVRTARGNALTTTRVFRVIGRPGALIALAFIGISLTSCAATKSNAFLGPAYDGPTAAYGYNLP